MSQVVLDDHLTVPLVLEPIQRWTTVCILRDLRPGEVITDDRVPSILGDLKEPTFVTIDEGFWGRNFVDGRYCIVYFALHDAQQELVPGLLRELFRHRDFDTRAKRMGKVIRVSTTGIQLYQIADTVIHVVPMERLQRSMRPRR